MSYRWNLLCIRLRYQIGIRPTRIVRDVVRKHLLRWAVQYAPAIRIRVNTTRVQILQLLS